jgi:hypothetical protein
MKRGANRAPRTAANPMPVTIPAMVPLERATLPEPETAGAVDVSVPERPVADWDWLVVALLLG